MCCVIHCRLCMFVEMASLIIFWLGRSFRRVQPSLARPGLVWAGLGWSGLVRTQKTLGKSTAEDSDMKRPRGGSCGGLMWRYCCLLPGDCMTRRRWSVLDSGHGRWWRLGGEPGTICCPEPVSRRPPAVGVMTWASHRDARCQRTSA